MLPFLEILLVVRKRPLTSLRNSKAYFTCDCTASVIRYAVSMVCKNDVLGDRQRPVGRRVTAARWG